jgi:hypothetical protein
MTSVQFEQPAPYGPVARAVLGRAAWWLLLLPPMVYAWRESHFQYDVYLPGESRDLVPSLMLLLAIMSVAMVGSVSWFADYPRPLVRMLGGYASITILHAILNQILTGDGKLFISSEAVLFALVMLPIISDKRVLLRFVRLNFILGIVLIALNMVTVLSWLNIITLPYRQVPRIGGEPGLLELDPLSFGLFGLTENYVYPGHPFEMARLQGFSLEPINWAYFVLLTLSCGVWLLPTITSPRKRLWLALLFSLIVVHIFFVYSSVAFIAVTAWILVLVVLGFVRRHPAFKRREALIGFLTVVLTPGLLIPFLIARIPNVALYLVAEDVLNKGSNWESKIGFLSMGNALYTQFLPTAGVTPSAGHNLILMTYLQFGYFLSIPLLVFLFWFVKRTLVGTPFPVLAGSALAMVAHTLVVPPGLFYPAGAMWVLMAIGLAYHSRPQARSTAAATPPRAPSPTPIFP